MRVIAGIYRSRLLAAPRGVKTRPTSDRLRETLFNVLAPVIRGAAVADLYAGSGAVGIEALSRGAARATFVENASGAIAALRANLEALGIGGEATVETRAANLSLRNLARRPPHWSLVFLDPPYDAQQEYAQTLALLGDPAGGLLASDAIVVAEHRRRPSGPLNERYGALSRYRVLEQGDAALSFFRLSSPL
ncbi:MAG: 16S rRNA (guanine(966)-N(2))-methyltransferase RsmD [Acidobacteriaceae bacterium]